MYIANLITAIESDINCSIKQKRANKGNKCKYKANQNEIVSILKDEFVIAIYCKSNIERAKAIDDILKIAQNYVIPIRPDREIPRNNNPRDYSEI